MPHDPDGVTLTAPAARAPAPHREETDPPVVARLVVEIRSDGSRTIARGAIEDVTTGQRTAVEARGTTPLALMVSLSRSIFEIPALARRAARALLAGKR
jgi:hypothetical protein